MLYVSKSYYRLTFVLFDSNSVCSVPAKTNGGMHFQFLFQFVAIYPPWANKLIYNLTGTLGNRDMLDVYYRPTKTGYVVNLF